MTMPVPTKMPDSPKDEFSQARRRARDQWEAEWVQRKNTPSMTDAFTDGFWAARDWCLERVLERFKDAPQHHDEIRKLLGVEPDP